MGEWRYSSTLSLDKVGWPASRPGRLISRERTPGTPWTWVWLGTKADTDMVAKRSIPSLTLSGTESRLSTP